MENIQTAIQLLIERLEELKNLYKSDLSSPQYNCFAISINEARKKLPLEKSQIICARMIGMTDDELSYQNSEQYYNETYINKTAFAPTEDEGAE